MHLLHYMYEIRLVDEISELKGLQRANVDNEELSLGKLLFENLSSEHFDLSHYSDAYAIELEKLIDSKSKGKTIVVKLEKAKEETKDLVEKFVIQKQRGLCRYCKEGFDRTDIIVSKGLANKKYYHKECADRLYII